MATYDPHQDFNNQIDQMAFVASQARKEGRVEQEIESDLWNFLLHNFVKKITRKMKRKYQDDTDPLFAYELAFIKAIHDFDPNKSRFTQRLNSMAHDIMGDFYTMYDRKKRSGMTVSLDSSNDPRYDDKRTLHEMIPNDSPDQYNDVVLKMWINDCVERFHDSGARSKTVEVIEKICLENVDEQDLYLFLLDDHGNHYESNVSTVRKRKTRALRSFKRFLQDNKNLA